MVNLHSLNSTYHSRKTRRFNHEKKTDLKINIGYPFFIFWSFWFAVPSNWHTRNIKTLINVLIFYAQWNRSSVSSFRIGSIRAEKKQTHIKLIKLSIQSKKIERLRRLTDLIYGTKWHEHWRTAAIKTKQRKKQAW